MNMNGGGMAIKRDRQEAQFEDFKAAYTEEQAEVEANRCLYCADAPCIQACPTRIDIPEFIRRIASGNIKGSAQTIFESNILGMSCSRVCPVEVLCVGDCVYNEMGVPPIEIGKLQRVATDAAFEHRWRFFRAGRDTGKRVALIGGGPASLAAAHELRRHGHGCTIYEKRGVLGGLNTTGVAPYKMRADRSVEEANWVLEIGGIEVKTGVEIGRDVSFAELEDRYDAVFIGAGLGPDARLDVPGGDLSNVYGAVDFIERFKLGRVDLSGVNRCLVVGGGNTAVDSVRETLGLGVEVSLMAYRGSEDRMSGYTHEWRAAQTEGARVEWRAMPVAFEGNGRVERVRCVRLDGHKDVMPDSAFTIEADLVLVAIGQSKLEALFAGLEGIVFERGRLRADGHGRTGRRGVFVAGDCQNGGKEVVNAVAEGKRAALAIHGFLTGGEHA